MSEESSVRVLVKQSFFYLLSKLYLSENSVLLKYIFMTNIFLLHFLRAHVV